MRMQHDVTPPGYSAIVLPDEGVFGVGGAPRRLGRHRGHVVARDMAVFGDNDESLDLGLGDQHPIERVAVVRWKSTRLFRVAEREREWREALLFDARFQVVRSLQLPQRVLDGDLPAADRTDEDFVERIGYGFICTSIQPLRFRHPPQESMGVE